MKFPEILDQAKNFVICLLLGGLMFHSALHAETSTVPLKKQDAGILKTRVGEFLAAQSKGYPGKVSVSVGAIDDNLKLTECAAPEVFLPPGSRAWGRTTVGVRCQAPAPWTIYVQASVSVIAPYLVAAAPLAQGQVITGQDVIFENGDLAQLPAGIFTDMAQVAGRIVHISMVAGTVLRQEMVRVPPVVQQGQTVMLVSAGNGFRISAEGQALGKANEGQVVQVKVASGQVVSGIARQGGQVDVSF